MAEPTITEGLAAQKVLPLFTCGEAAVGLQVLTALHTGGIRIVEFTNRTPAAVEVFRELAAAAAEQLPALTLGAGTIINRGALGDTTIGTGTKIDSLVIISHNVEVGENCLFVSQAGISGSVKIGNHVTFGGQVGVTGHLKIGDNVRIAAQAGVTHDLVADKAYLGAPARPINEMRRTFAAFNKLPELRNDIRHVQKRMEQLAALLEQEVDKLRKSEP